MAVTEWEAGNAGKSGNDGSTGFNGSCEHEFILHLFYPEVHRQ